MPLTANQRAVVFALESVEGVARVCALDGADRATEEWAEFVVFLRPYRGSTLAAAHFAVLRAAGRKVAGRVTYSYADSPAPTFERLARALTLTSEERRLAAAEIAARPVDPDEDIDVRPGDSRGQRVGLSILVVDNDPFTERVFRRVLGRTDMCTTLLFGVQAVHVASKWGFAEFDVVVCSASRFRLPQFSGFEPYDGLRLLRTASEIDPDVVRRAYLLRPPELELPGDLADRVLGVLDKPLTTVAALRILEAAQARLVEERAAAGGQDDRHEHVDAARDPFAARPPGPSDDAATIAALRAKGGPACEHAADLLERATRDPAGYLGTLRVEALTETTEGPPSAAPTSRDQLLEVLRAAARGLLGG